MDGIIAFCGLDCSACPAYVATVNNDDAARIKLAEEWGKAFNIKMKPEDVNCDGCLSGEGRHLGYCSACEIRKCGIGKAVENCAYCADYSCEKVSAFHTNAASAKETLDGIKKGLPL